MTKIFCNICGKECHSNYEVEKTINGKRYVIHVTAGLIEKEHNTWGEDFCFECMMAVLNTGVLNHN